MSDVFPTGKILAEKRLLDLIAWQRQAYKGLKVPGPSRQNDRRRRLRWNKRRAAEERLQAIKDKVKGNRRGQPI